MHVPGNDDGAISTHLDACTVGSLDSTASRGPATDMQVDHHRIVSSSSSVRSITCASSTSDTTFVPTIIGQVAA